MKRVFSFFFFSGVISVFCFSAALAQFNTMPPNATMEEAQEWLGRAITQNSVYKVKDEAKVQEPLKGNSDKVEKSTNQIRLVKFDGCLMSYTIRRTSEVSSKGLRTPSLFPSNGSSDSFKVSLNLKDIDTAEITLQETEEKGEMSVINMRTKDYKRVIKLKGDNETGNIAVSVSSIVVGSNIAEGVKDGLIHLVNLCQAEK
jgi:hypothetical protein